MYLKGLKIYSMFQSIPKKNRTLMAKINFLHSSKWFPSVFCLHFFVFQYFFTLTRLRNGGQSFPVQFASRSLLSNVLSYIFYFLLSFWIWVLARQHFRILSWSRLAYFHLIFFSYCCKALNIMSLQPSRLSAGMSNTWALQFTRVSNIRICSLAGASFFGEPKQ